MSKDLKEQAEHFEREMKYWKYQAQATLEIAAQHSVKSSQLYEALDEVAKTLLDGAKILQRFVPGSEASLLQSSVDHAHGILHRALGSPMHANILPLIRDLATALRKADSFAEENYEVAGKTPDERLSSCFKWLWDITRMPLVQHKDQLEFLLGVP